MKVKILIWGGVEIGVEIGGVVHVVVRVVVSGG